MRLKETSHLTRPDAAGLEVPINGTTYRVPAVSAYLGLKITEFFETMTEEPDEAHVTQWFEGLGYETSKALYKDLLGDTLDTLIDDGHSIATVEHVALTALAYAIGGDPLAEYFWENGDFPRPDADPKAPQDHAKPSKKN